MSFRHFSQYFLLFSLLFFQVATPFAQDAPSNPCRGPYALLNITNIGGNADSPCVVPEQDILLESSLQWQTNNPSGTQQNFPQADLRLGLPKLTEFTVYFPNYIHQNVIPHSGFGAMSVGMKHQFFYDEHWMVSAETLITPQNSNTAFGSGGWGTVVNGLINYTINPQYSVLVMLGGNSLTEPRGAGGGRFNSFTPDLVLSYAPSDTLNIFGEVFGQTKTSPDQGAGFNADLCVLYWWNKSLVFDVNVGQRLSGNLGGYRQFFAVGAAYLC